MIFKEKDNQILDTNIIMRLSNDDRTRLKGFAAEMDMPVSKLIQLAVNELHETKSHSRKKII